MGKISNFAPIQNYIDPNNSSILWYYIPGFNGYEISNTGIIRSMKHYKKYPFGMLIRPREVNDPIELFTKQFNDLTYELSDNNNKRQIMKRSTLLNLAINNQYHVQGYPRTTIVTDIAPRNIRCFIQREEDISSIKNKVHQVQFYYEKINTDEQNNTKDKSSIIKPLIFERTENNG